MIDRGWCQRGRRQASAVGAIWAGVVFGLLLLVGSETVPPPQLARIGKSSTAIANGPISLRVDLSGSHGDTPPPIGAVPHSTVSSSDSNNIYSDTTFATLAVPLDKSLETFYASSRLAMGIFNAPSTVLHPHASASD